MPWSRTGSPRIVSAETPSTGVFCPREARGNSSVRKALGTDERDEAAGDGADHGGPLRAANHELELLAATPADGHDEPAAGLELLVQRLRDARRGSGDCDRGEGCVLRQAQGAVADVDADALVARCGEVRVGLVGELGHALDRVYLS